MEPTEAVKTQEDLQNERNLYLQRVLSLEDEYENLKEKLPNLRDELMQVRGALAYVELALGELHQKEVDQRQELADQRTREADEKEAGEPQPPDGADPTAPPAPEKTA